MILEKYCLNLTNALGQYVKTWLAYLAIEFRKFLRNLLNNNLNY